MLTIAEFKAGFFDTARMGAAADKAERKTLSRFGAFVRKRSRGSIRRSKKVSEPGQPPRAHSLDKARTIKNILFAYEPKTQGVVIGPVLLNGNVGGLSAGTIPATLEKGGTATQRRRRKRRKVKYAPRPFMQPAFEHEQKSLPALWQNAIK